MIGVRNRRRIPMTTAITTVAVYRVVNVRLSAAALAVAVLIVVQTSRRRTHRLDPLAVALCAVFLAVGLRAAVGVNIVELGRVTPAVAGVVLLVDVGAVVAAGAFLAMRRRYRVFVESADLVREYETEYAQKER